PRRCTPAARRDRYRHDYRLPTPTLITPQYPLRHQSARRRNTGRSRCLRQTLVDTFRLGTGSFFPPNGGFFDAPGHPLFSPSFLSFSYPPLSVLSTTYIHGAHCALVPLSGPKPMEELNPQYYKSPSLVDYSSIGQCPN